MSRFSKLKLIYVLLAMDLVFHSNSVFACAMCYGGKTDSPLAQGMNWGIFSLLAMVGCVLAGIGSFFVFLARKSAAVSADATQNDLLKSTQKA
ncbi:MAG: hypothetical protein JWR26_4551 [Pedosphaera sp.]|nr:hypothetical protein [Pedosphaera sp.]